MVGDKKRKSENTILNQFKKHREVVDFKKSKSRVLDALLVQDYNTLSGWLEQFFPTRELRNDFFSKEGHFILRHILSYSEELSVLKLITDWFSNASIKAALKNNSYDAIHEFFLTERGVELFDNDSESNRKIRIDKFKFLLNNAEEILKEFIQQDSKDNYMTLKMKEDFVKAEEEVKKDKNKKYKL